MTLKQKKYVDNLSKGMTKKDAALAAGYSASVANSVNGGANQRRIETPEVREAFAALIRKKISPEKIAKRINEGLDAMETKFFQKDGNVVESRDVIAWSERRQYAELAAEYGDYVAPKKPVEGSVLDGIQVNVQIVGAP